jgi:hypothetical protein
MVRNNLWVFEFSVWDKIQITKTWKWFEWIGNLNFNERSSLIFLLLASANMICPPFLAEQPLFSPYISWWCCVKQYPESLSQVQRFGKNGRILQDPIETEISYSNRIHFVRLGNGLHTSSLKQTLTKLVQRLIATILNLNCPTIYRGSESLYTFLV